MILDNCEEFLQQSQIDWKQIAKKSWQASRILKRKAQKQKQGLIKTFVTQTKGIELSELRWQTAAHECQHCAWPGDKEGSHQTLDCICQPRKEKVTVSFPEKKQN
jgi:hypothetical protein